MCVLVGVSLKRLGRQSENLELHKYLIENNLRPQPRNLTAVWPLRIRNVTSSQTFAHFWDSGIAVQALIAGQGRPLGIYGCRSRLAGSFPAFLQLLWLGGRAHINMQLFCIFRFRSRARFLFLFIRRWRWLRRCGLTHISPCLWQSRDFRVASFDSRAATAN